MKERSLVLRDARRFERFRDHAWPLLRRVMRARLNERCVRCTLSERASPVVMGLCAECRRVPSHPDGAAPATRSALLDGLDRALRAAIGSGGRDYDALVLFSGGKDSTYLVDRLRRDYAGLRILTLTVDNSFMSPVALDNVGALLPKLDVDHVTVRPSPSIYRKLFAYAFKHLDSGGCSATVDQVDGDVLHDIGRNYAAAHRIPLLVSGVSRTQVERILHLSSFESPEEHEAQRRDSVGKLRLADILEPGEMGCFWDGTRWSADERPRVLFPFYAWDLDEEQITAAVVARGLAPPAGTSPLVTNSELVPLMGVVDMLALGYSSFEPEFAQMVRRGKADRRTWLFTFELLEYSAKTGRLLGGSLDGVLSRLGLTRAEVGIPW